MNRTNFKSNVALFQKSSGSFTIPKIFPEILLFKLLFSCTVNCVVVCVLLGKTNVAASEEKDKLYSYIHFYHVLYSNATLTAWKFCIG